MHESDDSIPIVESPDAIEKAEHVHDRVAIAVAVMAGVAEPARAGSATFRTGRRL
jgi:hypothetical protein